MRIFYKLAVTTALSSFIACPAYAQTQGNAAPAPEPSPVVAPAAVPTSGIADIVVTAQRRSESSQRAAVAIDVISGADLAKAGITRPEQLGEIAPALTVNPSSGGRTSFFLRGVGNFTATPQFDSAIAFNYDGVYIGKPGATTGFFYDLERIEVLLGPQGTLYGRNATGGAINVIPVHPKPGEFSGYLNGSYGNYNAYDLEGAVNVPMGPDGAMRISANRVKHDGYMTDGSGADDSAALRVQMLAHLTPNFTFQADVDYSQVRGLASGATYAGAYRGGTFVSSGLDPSIGLLDPRAQAYRETLFVTPAGRFSSPLDAAATVHSNGYGAKAEFTWTSDAGAVIFIPAWRRSEQLDDNQQIGTPVFANAVDDQHSFELRFVGNRKGILDYQFGGYYLKEDSQYKFGADQVTLIDFQNFTQSTETYAGFAHLTAHVSDKLRLVGAARYTEDKKSFSSNAQAFVLVCTTLPVPCPTVPLFPATRTFAEFQANPSYTLPPASGGALPVFANGAPTGAIISRSPDTIVNDTKYSKGKLTFRAAMEYNVAPRSLLYASVETGFRSGGLQSAAGYEVYKPETITAYTIGSKNRFFDNRVQLNAEGFYWKYKDQQLTSITLDANGNQGNFVKNVGNSTNYGVDVDALLLPTPTIRLMANVQYLHAYYNHFVYTSSAVPPPISPCQVGIAGSTATIDCSGFQAYNAPLWTMNLGAEKTLNLNDYKVVLSANTQYKTSRWVGFEYLQGMLQKASWTSNAQLEFAPQNNRWSITGFVRNIEGKRLTIAAYYWQFANAVTALPSPPRTYGVQGSVKF